MPETFRVYINGSRREIKKCEAVCLRNRQPDCIHVVPLPNSCRTQMRYKPPKGITVESAMPGEEIKVQASGYCSVKVAVRPAEDMAELQKRLHFKTQRKTRKLKERVSNWRDTQDD